MTNEQRREMLELAAMAAGVRYDPEASKPHPTSGAFWGLWLLYDREPTEHDRRHWNPLTDDGDVLRLAVRLRIKFRYNELLGQALAWTGGTNDCEARAKIGECAGDEVACVRLAVTRVAAEIGRQMQSAEGARETS